MLLSPKIPRPSFRATCLLFVLWVSCGPARARQGALHYDRIGLEEGLSHGSIDCIFQDRSGLLWFCTPNGLNAYDGLHFTTYRHDPHAPHSLSHNYVNWVEESRTGDLWVSTYGGGLNRLDPETGRFTRYRHDPNDPQSLSSDVVTRIFDALGHEVAVPAAGSFAAGRHEVVWDGRNAAGRPVPSGVYLYRMETEDHGTIRRMILVR